MASCYTLSQPVWGCANGLARSGWAGPLAGGDVALVLAGTEREERGLGGETLDGLQLAAICGLVGPVHSKCW